jgi:hypothetical protein
MNEYREWAKEKGLCVNCLKEKALKGRTMCAECLDKHKERCEKTRSEKSKEQRRKYIKRKRDLCIAFGICRECLKREAKIGNKCLECHVKEIKRNRNRTIQKTVPRSLRVEVGLCYICGQKVLEGKKLCEKHYKIACKNIEKGRNSVNLQEHYWRKLDSAYVKRNHFYKEQNKKMIEGESL